MYTRDQRHFSVKTTVKWPFLSQHFQEIVEVFRSKTENLSETPCVTSVRKYRSSSSARFTVSFPDWQNHPDRIENKLICAAQETVQEVTGKYSSTGTNTARPQF